MTLIDKLNEIENNFSHWIGAYNRGELVGNPVRIIGEAICKSVILKSRGESNGTLIIEGHDPSVPHARAAGKALGHRLDFSELIQATQEIGGFRRSIGVREHLELIRALTNPGSHSINNSSDALRTDGMKTLYNSVSSLLRWLFAEKLHKNLPNLIRELLTEPSNTGWIDSKDDITWNNFLALCHDFQPRRQYILVSPRQISTEAYISEAITHLPWRLVLDFNPQTDVESSGLMTCFVKRKGAAYKKSFTIDDKLEFDPKFEHYWFLANGQGTIPTYDSFNEWRKKYKRYLSDTLYNAFDKGSRSQPRVVVLLNIPIEFASAIIDEFNRTDESNLEYVLCNDGSQSYDSIISAYDNVNELYISPAQIAKGLRNTVSFSRDEIGVRKIEIPYKNEKQEKSYTSFKQEDYDYLNTLGIELVYRGIEKEEVTELSSDDFYKGATISWKDLSEEKDIIRESYEVIKGRLQNELERNKTTELELIHEAGAGGTTVSRRLAYYFCNSYPTVVLKQYEPRKTIAGLRIIYDQYIKSSLPLLIILELFELKSSSQLYRDLGNASKNAVILVVKRGTLQKTTDRRFPLRAELRLNEISLFENKFSLLAPGKRDEIYGIKKTYENTPRYISPFLYGLVTYEKEFKGIDNYVKKCIVDLNSEQKKVIAFVCLIYHFTQKAVPGEFFTGLFNTTKEKCDLVDLLGENSPVFEILHENIDGHYGDNSWRPRYAILGEEAMKIILAGENGNKDNWKTSLGQWLIELIYYIKMAVPTLNDDAKIILDSLFITRGDYDSNESRDQFTDAIKALVSPTAGVAVFEALTTAYADEAHFHGHFARYLYKPDIGIRNYDRAIKEANIALDLQSNDPTLVHTLGMCYKEKAEMLIGNDLNISSSIDDLEDEVKDMVESACDQFDRSIMIDEYNLYGHVAQSRLLLRTLDFGFKLSGNSSKERFITDPENDWYATLLDKIGSLLEDANYIIDQSKGLDNKFRIRKSADYVTDCESRYLIAIGQSLIAKNRYESLIKQTPAGYQFMVPRYRSLFVRCLLASKSTSHRGYSDAWERLSEHELAQSVGYLRENIFADPANTHHIRMWLQAIRYLKQPPSLEECISQVATWCQIQNQNSNSRLEGLYYLYILNAVNAISSGGGFDQSSVLAVREIREKMRVLPKNEMFPFEWYGVGNGIQQLKSHRTLGEFNSSFFVRNANTLKEVTGRIREASNRQSGKIILDCQLEAFFVPAIGGFSERNVNDRVKFYVGFRYDQLHAWDVIPFDSQRPESLPDSFIEDIDSDYETSENEVPQLEVPAPVKNVDNTLRQQLPGLKILGKVELPINSKKNSAKGVTVAGIPEVDKIYNGEIHHAVYPIGVITCDEIGWKVKFHVSHLRNVQFHKLRKGTKVAVKLFFENNVPKIDKDGKNYIAKEVRIISTT